MVKIRWNGNLFWIAESAKIKLANNDLILVLEAVVLKKFQTWETHFDIVLVGLHWITLFSINPSCHDAKSITFRNC